MTDNRDRTSPAKTMVNTMLNTLLSTMTHKAMNEARHA